jgi:hypothetical protein
MVGKKKGKQQEKRGWEGRASKVNKEKKGREGMQK